jgi:tetratricopeptide (TPR) repeat protein
MGFAGNLRTLALPEVLQTLNRIKATGVLRLAAAEGGRDVIFDQGELIGVSFRRGEERQALLRRLILEGQLDATTAVQISSSGRESQVIGRLIEGGIIDEAAVKDATQRQAEDELQSLFTWDYADFVFHDAGPEAEDVNALVGKAKVEGLTFNINSLLMESARRQDEWERVRQVFPDGGLVLGPREGQEAALGEAARVYPASAVIELVDATRSLDDIVKDSVATRLDVWTCLAGLLEKGLVVPLTRDDIIYHGDYLVSKNDLLRACSLYRRALAARPGDVETANKLADCLAKLGDAPEAAACYAQLAIGSLNAEDLDGAVAHARKAVQLEAKDPILRQTLVRCLLAQDVKRNAPEAVSELLLLVEAYTGLERLEDARSTCLKVLELDKGNEFARRQLARIFSAAACDEQSEDVVVCVQCGQINHREAQDCVKCKASLQLSCLACGRPVGVSDRLCIFCGADPHRGLHNRRAGGSPATSRLVNPEKMRSGSLSGGSQAVSDQLDALVATAKAKEEDSDWEGALEAWRQVAATQVDNVELISHIKGLETLVHDTFVEKKIEQGHQYRRVRRYWAAINCYKAALRTMPSDDPRAQRLVDILASTTRVGQRIALLYAAAILVILLGGGLALQPWLKQRRVIGDINALLARLQQLEASPEGSQLAPLKVEIDALQARVEGCGEGPRWVGARTRCLELSGSWAVAWQRAAARSLEQVDNANEQGDLKRARELLAGYGAIFHDRSPRVIQVTARLDAAQKRRDDLNARIQDAPRQLASAEADEAGGRLGSALSQFRSLAENPNVEVAAKAKAAVVRLAPRADDATAIVQQALDIAHSLQGSDLLKAEATLAAVSNTAVTWAVGERVREGRSAIAAALGQAKTDAAQLSVNATADKLGEFLRLHAGAPEAVAVRQRLDILVRASAARVQAMQRFQALIDEQKWEQAWIAGRDLVAGYGAQTGDVSLPLWIESHPSGAAVMLDGKPVGVTPCALRYLPGQKGELGIDMIGCQPLRRRLDEVTTAWIFAPQLARAHLWRAELGRPVVSLAAMPGGELAASTGDGLARLTAKGQVRWRVALGGEDLGNHPRGDHPIQLAGGRLALALAGSGIALVDARGVAQKMPTSAEVRGRPISYINEVLGATPRIAFAAEAIFSGYPGGQFARIPLPALAISGPVALAKDIDSVLVIADVRGRLVGIEESSRKVLWEINVQAADVGQLVAVSDSDVVALLDGARLACFGLTAKGAILRWTHQLEAPAVGDPAFGNGVVHIATGTQVVRVGIEGTVLPALVLPAAASCEVAVLGNRVLAGSADGAVHLFKDGEEQWSSPLGGVPTAVGLGVEAAFAASGNGVLAAFAP